MGDQIHVQPEVLRKHAEHVDGVAERVTDAAIDAAGISIADDGFGVMFGWLAGTVRSCDSATANVIRENGALLYSAAISLRQVANDFDTTDHGVAQNMLGVQH